MDARLSMATLLYALMVFGDPTAANLPEKLWSWSHPQEPNEYFFRRRENIPIKTPTFECKCPPYKECSVDFKLNAAAAEFLNMRGVLTEDELKTIKKEVKEIEKVPGPVLNDQHKQTMHDPVLRRQMNEELHNKGCCCPPSTLMMPTFITNQKFDDVAESFDKKTINSVGKKS